MKPFGVIILATLGLLIPVTDLYSQESPTEPSLSRAEKFLQLLDRLGIRPNSIDPGESGRFERIVPCSRPMAFGARAKGDIADKASGRDQRSNRAPTAIAGDNWNAFVGESWRLNGTCSVDTDGDSLKFSWTLASRPAGSGAELTDPTSGTPTLVMDVNGDYIAELVVNDGSLNSAPDRVTISSIDRQPVAEAGPDQSVKMSKTVKFDGTASYDREGDPIDGYRWTLIEAPEGSVAELASAETAAPSLTAGVPGRYIAELRVQAGRYRSPPDQVTVIVHPLVGRLPPHLDPIGAQTVYVGVTRRLQLVARDYNGFALTYQAEPLPHAAGTSLDAESGLFTYMPQADQLGDFGLTFTVDNGDRSVSETVAFNVTELPPDPGAAGKATLEGIDADGDGLRDDLQRFIAISYPDSGRTRAGLA